MIVGDLDRFAIGEDLVHSGHETGPFALVVEVVHHEEAAAIEVFPQTRGLGIGEDPIADADGIQEGPVEDFVAVDVHDLLDGAGVDAGEAADRLHEEALGFVGIGAPAGEAAEVGIAGGTVAQAGEGKFGLFPGVGRIVDRVLHFALELRPAILSVTGRWSKLGAILRRGGTPCPGRRRSESRSYAARACRYSMTDGRGTVRR